MEWRHPLALSAMRWLTSHPVVPVACAATFTTGTVAAALWCTGGHDPGFWIAPGLSTLIACFVGLALCAGLWITAVALRWVGASTGYGFCLAAFGLFCSVKARALTYFIFPPLGYGWRDRAPFPPPLPANGTALFWIHRNGGLFAFGFGLGLVLFESLRWRARRRHGPWWIPLGA